MVRSCCRYNEGARLSQRLDASYTYVLLSCVDKDFYYKCEFGEFNELI